MLDRNGKMKLRLLNLVLIILIFYNSNCLLYMNKELNCHPQLNLTLINKAKSSCIIKFYDKHTWEKVRIEIQHDSIFLNDNEISTNIIDYYWSQVDGCGFTRSTYDERQYISANIEIIGVESRWMNIYPWDTSYATYKFDHDCTHKIFDTIIIDTPTIY